MRRFWQNYRNGSSTWIGEDQIGRGTMTGKRPKASNAYAAFPTRLWAPVGSIILCALKNSSFVRRSELHLQQDRCTSSPSRAILLRRSARTGKTSLHAASRIAQPSRPNGFRRSRSSPNAEISAMANTTRCDNLFAQSIAEAAAVGPIVLLDEVELGWTTSLASRQIGDVHRATDAVLCNSRLAEDHSNRFLARQLSQGCRTPSPLAVTSW